MKDSQFWIKFEIAILFAALVCFACADYERANFIMLFLIHHRLIKEVK